MIDAGAAAWHEARIDGRRIARSASTLDVDGARYFPPSDVDMRFLTVKRAFSLCPYKGIARYYTVTVGDSVVPRGAWTYRHPLPGSGRIRGYIAFGDRIDVVEATTGP